MSRASAGPGSVVEIPAAESPRPGIGNRVRFATIDRNRGAVQREGMVTFVDHNPRQGEPWVYIAELGTNFLHVLYESDVVVHGSHYAVPHTAQP